MASATAMSLSNPVPLASTPLDLKIMPSDRQPSQWATLLLGQLQLIAPYPEDDEVPTSVTVDEDVLEAPRRRGAAPAREAAKETAALMYPNLEPLAAIIRYQKDLNRLRKVVLESRRRAIEENTKFNELYRWDARVRKQGPWDPVADPVPLNGPSSLPMPVEISDHASLAPFFEHLALGGNDEKSSTNIGANACSDPEPRTGINTIEFEKGVVYSDRRMDLCKMALGPDNIGALMESLKSNEFITHFLLGNNIIGPHGAQCIAQFLEEYPNRMETWYLAGNCIDSVGLATLVGGLVRSTSVTNIWLKRNPLGPSAAEDLFRLITQTANLRTLDLDQSELGDAGVAELFTKLSLHDKKVPLRHLYLNATGIAEKGATAIAKFLSSPHCQLEYVYAANNPMGDAGVIALAGGLKMNNSVSRLALTSVGMSDDGVIALCEAFSDRPELTMLDVGQSFATEDLGMRYNWVSDRAAPAIRDLVTSSPNLAYLDLSYSAMTHSGMNIVLESRAAADIHLGQTHSKLAGDVRARIASNIQRKYGEEVTPTMFLNDHRRWLVNDEASVRKIDSVYRNRDAGLARRGLKKLEKWWDKDDDTLEKVKTAVGPVCTMKKPRVVTAGA